MSSLNRIACLLFAVAGLGFCHVGIAQDTPVATKSSEGLSLSVEEIQSLLNSIDPYLPGPAVSGEVDIFGSTSMDVLAHGWAKGYKGFHPETKVIISAEGSETVFDRLAKNPTGIGMLSRPVTKEDLANLKEKGLKNPVSVQVAREALGVFVNANNPLEVISYPQLVSLFCAEDPAAEVNWESVGVQGELAGKPVHVIARDENSGSQYFIEKYLFHKNSMRRAGQKLGSNSELFAAVAEDPQAITISDYKWNGKSTRRLKLQQNNSIVDGNDHEILLGHYPITRPLTLVFDLDGEGGKAAANREFVRYALTQDGQSNTILAGFFPFDPPTLRAEMAKLEKAPRDP